MITKTIKEKFSELEENIAFRQERLIQYSENKLKQNKIMISKNHIKIQCFEIS